MKLDGDGNKYRANIAQEIIPRVDGGCARLCRFACKELYELLRVRSEVFIFLTSK